MTHWGWFWSVKNKHIPRTSCAKLTSIDSFKLLSDKSTGFSVQPLDIKAVSKDDSLQVTYRNHKASTYTIPVDKLPCNYGGFRYFFKCPLCQSRMRLLYLAQNSIFLCRKCLNLGYDSQRLRTSNRYNYMNRKIKEQVKAKGGDLDLNQRPRGMHQGTFQKLISRQLHYDIKFRQALNQELREWYGVKAEPYLDQFFD